MPGICIIITPAGKAAAEQDLKKMLSSMTHEAFYTTGTYSNEALGVYVGWVSQPGSYGESLPARNAQGSSLLFFCGEHHAEGVSNPAAVLQLLEQYGLDALPRLNGWFHGLQIDVQRNELTVFNDRYGMQRLYFSNDGDTTLYASEAKALLAVRPHLRKLDSRGLAEYLACGCVLENRSLFSGIQTLPAATVHLFKHGSSKKELRYFSPEQWETQPKLSTSEFHAQLKEALPRAIDRCVKDSVLDVAVSLTGGYDTRLIMAHLNRTHQSVPTYTFGGMYRECFDVKIARQVAHACGTSHQVLELAEPFLKSFPALAAKTVHLSDGLLGATNAYELYLNQLARRVAPVRITGSFGSEVMRKLCAFKAVSPPPGLINPDFEPHIHNAIQTFATVNDEHALTFSLFKQAPWFYYNRLAIEQSQVIVRSPYMDNDFVGLFYRRPDSLSDGRALIQGLIAEAAPILADLPTDTGNCSYLRQRWSEFLFKADYCYKSGMPQWMEKLHYLFGPLQPERLLIGRHRFAHFRVWFRKQLSSYVKEILLDPRTLNRSYFNRAYVEHMVTRHIKGDRNYTDDIERALTLELTCRQFIDN